MSTNAEKDEKYERILGLLERLRVLAEATDKKVGLLHADQSERRQKEAEEQNKEARRQRDEAARRQAVAEIAAAEAARQSKTEMLRHGVLP
jgi:hypothetical protein